MVSYLLSNRALHTFSRLLIAVSSIGLFITIFAWLSGFQVNWITLLFPVGVVVGLAFLRVRVD
jgi:hypothetical protein